MRGSDQSRRRRWAGGAGVLAVAVAATFAFGWPMAAREPTRAAQRIDPAIARDISVTKILGGYSRPVFVTNTGAPNQRIFIVEQTGKIKIAVKQNGTWAKVGTFLDITGKVEYDGNEQGLLGLAFAPDYATSGRFYVDYTRKGVGDKSGDTVIAEYRRKGFNHADPASARTVAVIAHPGARNHNAGMLAFGPDGDLYISHGDGGGTGDPEGDAQSLASLLGKILRIDPRDPDGNGPKTYSIPPGNPYGPGIPGLDRIWSFGLRNPWRFSFDRGTGDLWVGDVGQAKYEEIDHSAATGGVDAGKGVNYGWNDCEGLHVYAGVGGGEPPACTSHTLPVLEYGHGPHCAVVGGYVYRGTAKPAWDGTYVMGDSCSGNLWALDETGAVLFQHDTSLNISSFGEDRSGNLYVADVGHGTISAIGFIGTP